jgi:hypothetical protein
MYKNITGHDVTDIKIQTKLNSQLVTAITQKRKKQKPFLRKSINFLLAPSAT